MSVARSQDQIRKALRDAGADGVLFAEEWNPPKLIVRFIWPMQGGDVKQAVRLEVTPLPPRGKARDAQAQRERQAWRGIAHYLDGTLKAAAFGLIRFEDVFLSFMELPDNRTLGERVIPLLQEGRLALPEKT